MKETSLLIGREYHFRTPFLVILIGRKMVNLVIIELQSPKNEVVKKCGLLEVMSAFGLYFKFVEVFIYF